MIFANVPAIQLGELTIQSQYARPVTAIVETVPLPEHLPIFRSRDEQDKLTTPLAAIEPLNADIIEPLAIKPIPKATVSPRASIAGNTYAWGNCTHFAKSKRPDLPNNLGNANTWYTRAKAQGIPTGKTPKIGAIGVSYEGYYGHVVYISDIVGDNVHLIEMNWKGLNIISERVAPASNFDYIY